MTTKKFLSALFIAGAVLIAFSACKHKPTDAEVKAKVTEAISAVSAATGITADVKDGVVTLNGNVPSADVKTAVETAANALSKEGVKSVVDNIQVVAPVISPDDALLAKVKDATKDFPGVTAAVSNGVITLTGEIQQGKWKVLKQALDALKPKKVDAKGLKIK